MPIDTLSVNNQMSNVLMNKIRFAQLGFRSSDSFWCVMGYENMRGIWLNMVHMERVGKNNMGNNMGIGINGSIKINLILGILGYYAHSTTWFIRKTSTLMEVKCIFEVLHDENFQEKSRILRPRKKKLQKNPIPRIS